MTKPRTDMGLAGRAALIAALAFVLAFLAAGLFALGFFERQYVEQTGQHQFKLLRTLAEGLDNRLTTSRSVLAAATAQVAPSMLRDAGAAQRFLESRTFLRRRFDQGLLLVKAGEAQLFASDSTGRARINSLDAAELAMLAAPLANLSQARVSRPFAGRNGEPQLSMAMPVRGADGESIGWLLGRLSILSPEIAGGLTEHRIGESGYLFMTGADRLMLMHPDRRRLMRKAAEPGLNLGYDRAVDQGFEGTVETVNSTGLHALSSFARVPSMNWILAANYPMAEVEAPYWRSVGAVSAVAALAVLSLLGLLLLSLRRLFAPLGQLRAHLAQVGRGEGQPFTGKAHAEIADIAHAYNEMIERLHASEQARRENEAMVTALNAQLEARVARRTEELQRANQELSASLSHNQAIQGELLKAEKQAALGRMLASISHELNTPMGNALCTAEALRARSQETSAALGSASLSRSALSQYLEFSSQACDLVERNLQRATTLLDSYRQLSNLPVRQGPGGYELRAVVSELLAAHRDAIERQHASVAVEVPDGLRLQGEPDSLKIVLGSLLSNALEHGASPGQGSVIRITAALHGADELRLQVEDQGKGIAAQDIDRVFDPMFTTKLAQGHSGLGLSLAQRLVTDVLGGTIQLHNREGQGLSVELHLPVRCAEPQAAVG